MITVTVNAYTRTRAIEICAEVYGWTPDAIREVDSGDDNTPRWICFESAIDADIWDNQI